MRGIVAKLLRKLAYGDTSLRIERRYLNNNDGRTIGNDPDSPRAVYRRMKKAGKAR